MDNYTIKIKNSSTSDLIKIKERPLRESFQSIIETLIRNPYEPTQSFEKLFPPERGLYSRRINIKHRVVYTIDEDQKIVTIYSAESHYRD
ncbi:Txe/YoeB family addiction module toxin [Aerococcus agrisoli]|uniref:Endoribonuclease YoeB n=1 Tax=Aerococcus agrisoli TaxID=2487350 RepID=A0A3N4H617_9LACT|nr:Txe/YoeB family addiction module toxin [Aerococcus agrisoli]RPA60594.1 Txe/YoeB family addiction module toxin [Aerococcus agrisoli]